MIKTAIRLPETLLEQVKVLANQLHQSQNQVFTMAVEQFIERYLSTPNELPDESEQVAKPAVINQGDIYWLRFDAGHSPQSDIPHPYVVIQENVLNHSRLATVVVCALTSNLKRASYPGNVLLEADEANLPRQSVVEISKVAAVAKIRLADYIGSLNEQRVQQILVGMRFQQVSFFNRD